MKQVISVVLASLAVLAMFVIYPAIIVLFGWLGGFLVELFLGSRPTEWMNLMFNTDRFVEGDLPKVTAVLAIIGSYFRSVNRSKET